MRHSRSPSPPRQEPIALGSDRAVRGESADSKWISDLFAKDRDGYRSCVPVFGTGLNIQAATLAGYKHKDDWNDLLVKVGRQVLPKKTTLKELPTTHLALWEALVCRWAKQKYSYPFEAERELQNLICEELRRQESECRAFQLYRDIATAGFRDILSLNFDRRIAFGCKRQSFVSGASPCPLGSHGESLFRHSLIRHSNGKETRVWYPHGDVKKSATIKFGVRKYGYYIAVIKEYVDNLDGAWRYHSSSLNHVVSSRKKQRLLKNVPTWVPIFLNRPLVFIGCGLSSQEWPLWWLLRRRGESSCPPTLYLTVGTAEVPAHFSLLPGMKTIAFDSHDGLWSSLLRWLADSKEEVHA